MGCKRAGFVRRDKKIFQRYKCKRCGNTFIGGQVSEANVKLEKEKYKALLAKVKEYKGEQ